MVLSKTRIIKELIRLRGCAGWCAPVLLQTPEDRFSRVEAHTRPLYELHEHCTKDLMYQKYIRLSVSSTIQDYICLNLKQD